MSLDFGGGNVRGTFSPALGPYGITLACWVKDTTIVSGNASFAIGANNGVNTDRAFAFVVATNRLAGSVRGTSSINTGSTAAIDRDGLWSLVVLTITSSTLRDIYYVDSARTATSTSLDDVGAAMGDLNVGSDISNATTWDGKIGEMCVWDSVLTTGNIDSLAAGDNPTTVDSANLKGYWSFVADGSGTYADESGNGGPTLTVNGTVTFDGADHPAVDSLSLDGTSLGHPYATERKSYTATSAQSNAISEQIRRVRVIATTDAFIAFGASPTATTSDTFLPAGREQYFLISPGEKIGVIRSSVSGTLYITELHYYG